MIMGATKKEILLKRENLELKVRAEELERDLSKEETLRFRLQAQVADCKETIASLRMKLEGMEGQLKEKEHIVSRLLDQAQNITISGARSTVNIVSKGSVNSADGMNTKVEI
jgi:hypothetical protein